MTTSEEELREKLEKIINKAIVQDFDGIDPLNVDKQAVESVMSLITSEKEAAAREADSNSHITLKMWHDTNSPRLTISYSNPEKIFEGNGWSLIQAEKMFSDYFRRKDIKVTVKDEVRKALVLLMEARLTQPHKEQE